MTNNTPTARLLPWGTDHLICDNCKHKWDDHNDDRGCKLCDCDH